MKWIHTYFRDIPQRLEKLPTKLHPLSLQWVSHFLPSIPRFVLSCSSHYRWRNIARTCESSQAQGDRYRETRATSSIQLSCYLHFLIKYLNQSVYIYSKLHQTNQFAQAAQVTRFVPYTWLATEPCALLSLKVIPP